ncbi:acyl-CoA dehydrogenase family protein [Cupriavidus basilensis]
MNVFGLNPVVVFGNQRQKDGAAAADRRAGESLLRRDRTRCRARHHPSEDPGRAVGRRWQLHRVDGRKIWISTAQVADRMLLLARTTPLEQVAKPTQGLSLFYTALDRKHIEVREIHKMGRAAVDSNMLFIDGPTVPVEDRIGEEGRGFEYILHGLNPERILIAAEAVGLGRVALEAATRYARERTVFGRPIGQNQGIQHPLAQAWMALEAADMMVSESSVAV